MREIGFLHNLPPRGDFENGLTPSVRNRVELIDRRLRPEGFRLFFYSPARIDPARTTVEGFHFENHSFVPTVSSIPRVNGNWTHRTRRLLAEGMGYAEFNRWAASKGLGIYVPHALSELLGNKLETYKLVRGFHASLHPHCEPYRHSVRQLEHFVEASRLTFIKPRTGSKGNRIVTLRRDDEGLTVTRYNQGRRKVLRAARVAELMDFLEQATTGSRKFIVQHGVETMRHEGSTFDIRVTMAHDGSVWRWLHEARLSPSGSDVSNVGQGGHSTITEDLLFDVLGHEGSREVLQSLRDESFGLAAHLERLHPGAIPEVAFDFALDREARPRLLEINTKPGLPGPGTNVHLRDTGPEHERTFAHWVIPHTDCLARFLMTKDGVVPRERS